MLHGTRQRNQRARRKRRIARSRLGVVEVDRLLNWSRTHPPNESGQPPEEYQRAVLVGILIVVRFFLVMGFFAAIQN